MVLQFLPFLQGTTPLQQFISSILSTSMQAACTSPCVCAVHEAQGSRQATTTATLPVTVQPASLKFAQASTSADARSAQHRRVGVWPFTLPVTLQPASLKFALAQASTRADARSIRHRGFFACPFTLSVTLQAASLKFAQVRRVRMPGVLSSAQTCWGVSSHIPSHIAGRLANGCSSFCRARMLD